MGFFHYFKSVESGSQGSSVINLNSASCRYEQTLSLSLSLSHTLTASWDPELSFLSDLAVQWIHFFVLKKAAAPVSPSPSSLWFNVFWDITHHSPDSTVLMLEIFGSAVISFFFRIVLMLTVFLAPGIHSCFPKGMYLILSLVTITLPIFFIVTVVKYWKIHRH